jgi:sugar lactone lactonase YvrE
LKALRFRADKPEMKSKGLLHSCLVLITLGSLGTGATAQTLAPVTAIPGTTPMGAASSPLTFTLTMTAGGVAEPPVALTQGLQNADFTVVSGGSCAVAAYTAGQQCTVEVVFQPVYPGLRQGAVVLQTSSGLTLAVCLLAGTSIGPLPVLAPGRIDVVAGDYNWIYQGDGVLATKAPIFLPTGVVTDGKGDIFLSDSLNNRIRRVDATSGIISTIAGTGTPGYSGNGVPSDEAMVSTPNGLAIDGAGDLYIADTGNHVIRRIDAFSGLITTIAGTPTVEGFAGDGGPATSAQLAFPEAISFDAAGDLIIADTGNNVVRQINAVTGRIRTIAGTGAAGFSGDNQSATSARLNGPWSAVAAADGSIDIADFNNNRVRRVDPSGTISTIAGDGSRGFSGDGSDATQAVLTEPASLVFDPAGDLYIADSGNSRVREINAASNVITTFSGNGSEEFNGAGGPADQASLYGPNGLFFDSAGNLFVADMFHNRVMRISGLTTALLYDALKVGKISPPLSVFVANDGNADLTLKPPVFVNAADDAITTTCTAAAVLPSAGTCNVGAEFAPLAIGNPIVGSITVASDSPLTAPVIDLSGQVLSIQPTTISLTSSANPSLLGVSVTFSAVVANGLAPLEGTIVFLDGATQICSVAISNAAAACSTSALTLGSHSITANYSGDDNNAASVSAPLIQVVKQTPLLTLSATPNPSIVSASVALAVTATAPTGIPTGAVTFYDGNTALNSATLSAAGTAAFSTATLTPGTHSLTVHYPGDTSNAAAVSNIVSQVVQQASTSITLYSSNATALAGTTVTFTGIVFSTAGPTPTGTVSFQSGTTTLGSTAVDGTGKAVLSLSTLAPGTYTVIATYSGDGNDQTSVSLPLLETIQQIPTASTLAPDVNPIAAGATLNLTATVTGATPGGGALTGRVSFREGSISYGSAQLNTSGVATLSLNTLPAGSHSLVAHFGGDTNYAVSVSSALVEVVQSTGSATALSSPSATTFAGEPATFTATVTSSTATPTGNVVFADSGVSIGQAQLNAQGVASFTTSLLTVGSHSVTAAYAGDGSYTASTSAALPHTIALATTGLSLAAPNGTVEAGKAFALSATLTNNGFPPTGALTLRDGSTTIGTQTVAADGTFTFPAVALSVGTHPLTAFYAGDTDNASATSPLLNVVVVLAPTSTGLSTSASPASAGQNVTFTASVSSDSPNPTGTVNFLDGTTPLGSSTLGANGSTSLSTNTLAVGPHSITAAYLGDANHATSTSSVLTQQIVQVSTASFTSNNNPSNAGANVVFTVRISGSGSPVPTGTVIFRDGSLTIGQSALDNTGGGSMQTALLTVGSHSLTATYSGDANYAVASAALLQTVQNENTQITLSAGSNPAIYAQPLSFTATVTGNGGIATGPVTFTDGSTPLGSGTLNASGVATLTTSTLSPGIHSIVASYAGNASIGASSSTPLSLVVEQSTGVSLASNADPTQTLSPITLTAKVSNGGVGVATGTITFADGPTPLGTSTLDSTGSATLPLTSMTAGSHNLQASYAGDATNFSATSPVLIQVITLRPTAVTLTATSDSASGPQQVTLIGVVRWTGPVPPTGTLAFMSGTTVLSSIPIDSTGVATLNIQLQSASESLVAVYNGDASYAGSSSLPASITVVPTTQFTMQIQPSSVSFASKQHQTVTVNLASQQSFTDTLQFGCLGLPTAATCTFSSPQMLLAANGTGSVQLTIDTGDPLGAGASASRRTASSNVFLCLLPCLLAIGFGARRRRIHKRSTLLLLACAAFMTLSAAGCSGLQINGTPPGTYVFKVTASGVNTGVTLSQNMTLTVTP